MIAVLYVDADRRMYACLSYIFEKYGGITLVPAASAEAALSWLSRNHADVIVSEYSLPGMNGVALLGAVQERGITTPFIIFTEHDGDVVKKEAYRSDAFGFVVRRGAEKKPIMDLLRLIYRAAGDTEAGGLTVPGA